MEEINTEMNIETTSKLTRYSNETSTCYGLIVNDTFINGFFSKFQDSFCYTFVLQFLVVTLMYMNVGRGKYWEILFYAAIAGLCGCILENATVAYICADGKQNKKYRYVLPFLIDEIFWITCEFSIPYLNLIKMKAFAKGRNGKIVKYLIYLLTIPFVYFRLCIGYYRMIGGYLQDERIHRYHGYAFAVMALADLICTFSILYFVKKINSEVAIKTSNINDYIKHSSYTILLTVDIVSTLLSICNIVANIGPFKDSFPGALVTPFHCLKCSFILILAADALIFKYGASMSTQASSGTNSKTYGTGSGNYNYSTKSGNYKTRFYQNDISSNSNVGSSVSGLNVSRKKPNMSQFNALNKSDETLFTNSRSIIKNYTNLNSNNISNINNNNNNNNNTYDNSMDERTIEVKVLPNQNFGFLNKPPKYY